MLFQDLISREETEAAIYSINSNPKLIATFLKNKYMKGRINVFLINLLILEHF